MKTEYWRQVWQLAEKARLLSEGEREDFVWANASDSDMAREVLSLLAQPEGSAIPSWSETSGEGASSDTREMGQLAGSRIGRYAVGELIGWGASGEVYNAFDAELERLVAIKFLRCGDADSGWRAEGFLREARAASSLNHPGIVTIHEVMQSEAGLAIVMELVEGKPLRKICGKEHEVASAARWISQAAGALAAAHNAQIIHRDIKPENIVLRPDGLVKVLDFGLAQRGALPDGSKPQLTGTLRYMSPEQARQEELHAASDVYSLGVVLYELLAGRHPYTNGGFEETLQAVRGGEIEPISRRRRDLPKVLETLLEAMLRRVPERRPSAHEVASRLEDLQRQMASPAGSSSNRLWVAGAAVAALLVLGVLWFNARKSAPLEPSTLPNFGQLAAVPLTSSKGFDSWPDLSPDGKLIAYGWGKSPDAYTHLYLKDWNQDEPIPLLESRPGARIGHPRWSPDGKRIFFKQTSARHGEAIFSVAKDGSDLREESKLMTGELSSGLDISADGKTLLFSDRESRTLWRFYLYQLDLVTKEKKQISSTNEGWGDWDPKFSPDGKQIAFKRVHSPGDDQMFVMPATGGAPRRLNLPRESIYGYTWTPEAQILIAGQLGSVIHGLWLISPSGQGQPASVFESGFNATMPAVNRERVVWVNQVKDYNLYSVPIAGGTPVRRVSSPVLDSRPGFSRDGRLAFISQRSGSPEIWLSRLDSSSAVRVTDLKGDLTRPSWSPDGTRLLFSVQRFGISKIYEMTCPSGTLQCEAPRELREGTNPTWAAGKKGYFFRDAAKGELWWQPGTGEHAVWLCAGEEALATADGKWLYLARRTPGGRFFRIPLDSEGKPAGPEEMVIKQGSNSVSLLHWTLAGAEVLYWESSIESKFSGLRSYNVNTRETRTILETVAAEYPAVSPDGKSVWFAQPDTAGATLMGAERRR